MGCIKAWHGKNFDPDKDYIDFIPGKEAPAFKLPEVILEALPQTILAVTYAANNPGYILTHGNIFPGETVATLSTSIPLLLWAIFKGCKAFSSCEDSDDDES